MYSKQNYEKLLQYLISRDYRFASFEETVPASRFEKVVYLRHDIDYSPAWALAFARINARHGVMGTFFFQLRSPLYNLLSYSVLSLIREIARLGQRIGLHYTIAQENAVDDASLTAHIVEDYRNTLLHLEDLSPVFSWHNPSLAPDVMKRGLDMRVSGLVSTYSRYFLEEVKYFSDSNIRYSVAEFKAIINSGHPQLQLLFHPFQWMAGGRDMQQILANTWKQVIREKEEEFLKNHVYRAAFPHGVPDSSLDALAADISSIRKL